MPGEAVPARGWVRYDVGNSAFATVVVGAILPVHFQANVVPAAGVSLFGGTWNAESLWALVTGVGPLIMLLVMPVLGALADRAGAKARLLLVTSYSCAAMTAALFVATGAGVVATLTVFLLAILSYAAANVFYDGLLTEVASPAELHRVSARGIAAGFVGGAAYLSLALTVIAIGGGPLASRVAIASTGVWFAAFTWWSWRDLRAVHERGGGPEAGPPGVGRVRAAVTRNLTTLRRVRRAPDLARFVGAHLLYSNAIQAFVVLTAVYSAETLRLPGLLIMGSFLIVQVLAIPACHVTARLTRVVPARTILTVTLLVWVGVFIVAASLPPSRPVPYVVLAATVGLVLGPVIAIGRSLFASMIPESSPAQFFAFFSLASKLSSVSGPLVFAWVRQASGSGRAAIAYLGAFVVVGLLLLRTVDVDRGREARHRLLDRDARIAGEGSDATGAVGGDAANV